MLEYFLASDSHSQSGATGTETLLRKLITASEMFCYCSHASISLLSFYFVLGRDFTNKPSVSLIGMTISAVKVLTGRHACRNKGALYIVPRCSLSSFFMAFVTVYND